VTPYCDRKIEPPVRMQVKLSPLSGLDNRLHPRRLVRLRARFQDPAAGAVEAIVVDLSEKGCRLEGGGELGEGDQLLIRLPGLEARPCRVVWVTQHEAGCEFDMPLYPAERELVRAQNGALGKVRPGVFGRPIPGSGRR
jgi:hypothetical protein